MNANHAHNSIAFCGLNCKNCDAYKATVNNDDTLREKTAKLWAEANNAPITPEMINCLGCLGEGIKTPFCESMCPVRQCAIKKGIASCGQCAELKNCGEIKQILDNSEEARANLIK